MDKRSKPRLDLNRKSMGTHPRMDLNRREPDFVNSSPLLQPQIIPRVPNAGRNAKIDYLISRLDEMMGS